VAPTELSLRPADRADLPAVASVHLAARAASEEAGTMPPGVHPPGDVRAWVAGWDLTTYDVWLAEVDAVTVGYARFTATWLDDLYVLPDRQREGVGAMLLDLVKAQRPGGFGLWVFESNTPARAFYRRHGLVERERTDGSENEEGAPDIRLEWMSVSPVRMTGGQDVG